MPFVFNPLKAFIALKALNSFKALKALTPLIQRSHFASFSRRKRNLTKRQIARFCGQLQMLLAAGVPLLEAMRIVKNILQREEIDILIQHISEGESLGKTMQLHFPSLAANSIECAEKIGNLEEALGRLCKYYEDRAEVEDKLKSALIYPAFVIILCILSLIVLFLFVLPGFKTLFVDLDADLPFFTQVIIGSGDVLSRFWYVPLSVLLTSGILFTRYRRTEHGAKVVDGLALKIRSLCREQIIQGFRALGSLLQAGIPITEALNTTANSSNNRAFKQIVFEIKEAIENGERMSEVLSGYKIFPREAIQMISVGENSGTLDRMLLNISSFYEKEREVFIKRFTTLLEPALTLFVGVVVGVIALAMFLPMINMISKLQ